MYIWILATIIAFILLFSYWRTKNAVWGGFTLGIIIGLAISISFVFNGKEFSWFSIGKGAIVGILLGFVAELIGKLPYMIKKK